MQSATQGILAVARSVLEKLDVGVVLTRVLEAARELTGARYAALGVLDDSRTHLVSFHAVGIDEHTREVIGPLPTGRGVLGQLIRDPRPLRLADVGSHPYSYGFPVGHPPMHTFLGVPIVIGDEPYGNLYLTEKRDGLQFTDEDEAAVGMLAQFAALAIDHARRYSTAETERARLERTVQALDAMIQISRTLGGETDLDAILELVAKRGRALVAARALIVEVLEDEQLIVAAGAGELPAGIIGQRMQAKDTVAELALTTGQTRRLSEEGNRTRFARYGGGTLGLMADDGLVVPLVFRERVYGVLIVLDRLDDDPFTAEHQRLLESFASSAATAVATAQSAADERRRQRIAAAEAERGRWARELHDETLQALGTLRLLLAGAQRRGDTDAMRDAIAQALEQLNLDITSLRALIAELRPAALDELGLEPALMALVERVQHSGLTVRAQVELPFERGEQVMRLEPELETGVYRIVQEALTNAVKHGEAARADVAVVLRDGCVRVAVTDDGAGFDPSAATSGFGVAGMRERAELLGGTLSMHSKPGEGTTVAVTLPATPADGAQSSERGVPAADR
ncbi:MAG TPA: GAF domain-containing protein [Solirubrobacteraceae bacterium]|nr:GAF domain-containing protein [Solirubrobacteraceae bacterium]